MKITKNDVGLLILRIGIGLLMLFHGIDKISDISFIKMILSEKNIPEIFAYGVYVGEILAPIFLIIGYRVKIAAYVFISNCLSAVLLVFPDEIFSLNETGGWGIELLGLYMLGAITLVFTGGGNIALFNNFNNGEKV